MNRVNIEHDAQAYRYTLVVNDYVVLCTSSKSVVEYYARTATSREPPYVLPVGEPQYVRASRT